MGLANDAGVFVVSCTYSSAICNAPTQVKMDIGVQLIMIGKLLINTLGLTALYLKSCAFTILTSGGIERATGQTWKPLQFVWRHVPLIIFEVCGYMRHQL